MRVAPRDPAQHKDCIYVDEDTLTLLLSNRKTAALVGWNPFMHDPKLRGRLSRIDRQTLVIWGESDGLVSPAYGRAYASCIPGACFVSIAAAGHYPDRRGQSAWG